MSGRDDDTQGAPAQGGAPNTAGPVIDLWAERDISPHCYGCGRENPHGLGLRPRAHGEVVVADWTPAERFRGYANLCHGGVVAAVLDEMMGWMIIHCGAPPHATVKLDVEYRAPVWLGRDYVARAWIDERRPRLMKLVAEVVDGDSDAVAARGHAVFVKLDAAKAQAFMGGVDGEREA